MQLHDFTSLCPVGRADLVPLLPAQISVSAPHLHLYLQSDICPEPKRSGTAQAEQGAFEARQAESLRSTSVHPHPQHHVHPRRLGNVGHGLFRGRYCTSCEHLERI